MVRGAAPRGGRISVCVGGRPFPDAHSPRTPHRQHRAQRGDWRVPRGPRRRRPPRPRALGGDAGQPPQAGGALAPAGGGEHAPRPAPLTASSFPLCAPSFWAVGQTPGLESLSAHSPAVAPQSPQDRALAPPAPPLHRGSPRPVASSLFALLLTFLDLGFPICGPIPSESRGQKHDE